MASSVNSKLVNITTIEQTTAIEQKAINLLGKQTTNKHGLATISQLLLF